MLQPPLTQRFVEAQARHLADAIVQRTPQVRFSLPDQVIGPGSDARPVAVAAGYREQMVGGTGFLDRLSRSDVRKAIAQRLQELELISNREVAISAKLLRHATVIYMVHGMLPAGRSVKYVAEEGEEIPTQTGRRSGRRRVRPSPRPPMRLRKKARPKRDAASCWCPMPKRRASSICRSGWPLIEHDQSAGQFDTGCRSACGVDAALHGGAAPGPRFCAVYRGRRAVSAEALWHAGAVGQSGPRVGALRDAEIINTIKARAAQHDLNRGLSLSVPYFDDQELATALESV